MLSSGVTQIISNPSSMDENKYLSIKQWAADDRPREKLLAHGVRTLSDAELLAILIATGTKNLSAIDLARSVLQSAGGNLNRLGKQTVADLTKIYGIGEAKAITIVAALELGRRRKESDIEKKTIKDAGDISEIMQPILCDLPHEEFWVLILNRANCLIDKQRIGSGGVNATIADVRLIMKLAIEKLASSIVLVHNHPSGSTKPSNEDKQLTAKIMEAAKLFDIKVLDHIIIADTNFFSFHREGLI